jgi:polysaccharide export outer membrane protein
MHSRLFFVIILCLGLASIPGLLRAGDPKPESQAPAPAAQLDYVLQASDLIRVQIFQEDGLQRDVRLSQECTVTLPLIGTINLKGMTVRQANDLIQKLYDRDYLVNPQVSLSVLEYAVRTVNVLGAVNKAGTVTFPPEQSMNLLDAIAGAGGFTRLADRSKVKLTRMLPDGKTEAHIINADEIIQGEAKKDWSLQKGDVVYVPERVF